MFDQSDGSRKHNETDDGLKEIDCSRGPAQADNVDGGAMKTCLVMFAFVGLMILPSAARAQDDFSGRWEAPGSTLLADLGMSPFGAPAVFTQTADTLSWPGSDGRTHTLRLNGTSVVYERTYTARWSGRALLLEWKPSLPDGSAFTLLQILFRNEKGELELISMQPMFAKKGPNAALAPEGTEMRRVVYQRRD
jgi:hypothetical protein